MPQHVAVLCYGPGGYLFGCRGSTSCACANLQRAYFREMRAIIDSEPVETVVLANMQLVELSSGRSTDA